MSRDRAPMPWPPAASETAGMQVATFAGGCFWSTQLAFDRLHGVGPTAVGYANGHADSPTYEQVCSGTTGYAEGVQLYYDPSVIGYGQLVEAYMAKINPMQKNGQGADHGPQYRTGIYYHTPEQKAAAEAAVSRIPSCAVEVKPFENFFAAEQYHQKYLEKGGSSGRAQCADKGCCDAIRCYG